MTAADEVTILGSTSLSTIVGRLCYDSTMSIGGVTG